jgi:aminotransferase
MNRRGSYYSANLLANVRSPFILPEQDNSFSAANVADACPIWVVVAISNIKTITAPNSCAISNLLIGEFRRIIFTMPLPPLETVVSPLHLSDLAPRTVQSEIRAMTVACDNMGGVNLAQGVCDTDPPNVVLEGAYKAIREGHNIYTRLDGIARLRHAIAAQLARTHHIEVDPDREILITSGATGGFQAALAALFNPGDEILLFEPFYGYHANMIRGVRAVPVPVALSLPTAPESEWKLDPNAVRAAITSRTRAMVLCTPSNPAGKIFTQPELEQLAAIAEEHNLFILSDEIYEHFLYPRADGAPAQHLSPASLPGLRERTILISGFSKTFSVTGWRVGYLVADAKWIPSIGYFHDLLYVCAPAPFQHACADGVEQLPQSFYTALADDHLRKRAMLVEALRVGGLTPHIPDGAYYILASTGNLQGANAAEKSRNLLARTGVASVAGSAFFRLGSPTGESLLRFCFAKKDTDLAEACRRLAALSL